MLDRSTVTRPLLAYVLNKFAVPGFKGVATFGPIKHKLWHGILNKLWINPGPLQNLAGILTGQPIALNGFGFVGLHGKGSAVT